MKFSDPRVVATLLVTIALVVYGSVVTAPFAWDDKTLIRDSPMLGDASRLREALTSDFWAISANPRRAGMYRPLVTLSYFADRAVFGTSPVGPHAVNLALHLLAAALLAWLALELGAGALEAALAAGLFAFHPAVVEAVANIASRGDLLATCFLLAAFLSLRREGAIGLGLAAVFTALAQLSKESAFVALPLALTLDLWSPSPRGGEGRGEGKPPASRLARISAALIAPTLATLALRHATLGAALKLESSDWIPLQNAASNLLRYATTVLWPTRLVPYQSPTTPSVLSTVAALLLISAAVALIRRAPLFTAAVAWFLLSTAPVVGWLPIEVRFSGLLLYLPLTGLALLAARGLSNIRPVVAWSLVAVLALGAASLVPQWRSDEALWAANVEAEPTLPAPRLNLANALAARGAPEAATEYAEAAQRARAAGDGKSLALASLGLGNLALKTDPATAERHFATAVEVSQGRLWQAGINVAVARAMQSRFAEADQALEQQWAATPLPPVASAGLRLAQERGDASAQARWAARLPSP